MRSATFESTEGFVRWQRLKHHHAEEDEMREGDPAGAMPSSMNPEKSLKAALWLTVAGGMVDLALAIAKIVFGYVSDLSLIHISEPTRPY